MKGPFLLFSVQIDKACFGPPLSSQAKINVEKKMVSACPCCFRLRESQLQSVFRLGTGGVPVLGEVLLVNAKSYKPYEMTINDSKLYPTNLSISHIKFTRTITHSIAFMTAFTVAVNAMMELFMEDVMKKKSHGGAN